HTSCQQAGQQRARGLGGLRRRGARRREPADPAGRRPARPGRPGGSQAGGGPAGAAPAAGRRRAGRCRRPGRQPEDAARRGPAGPGTLVILGAETGPADIGKMLVAAGWPEATPFAVTWNGTTTAQQTVMSTLGSVAADLKAAGISMLTTHGPAVAVAGEAV